MEKITAMEVRRNLGELIARIKLRGEEFVLEKGGKPTAVLVPYHKIALARDRAWEKITSLFDSAHSSKLTEKELEELTNEAVHQTRRKTINAPSRP